LRLETFQGDVCNAKRLQRFLDYVLPDEFQSHDSKCESFSGVDFLGTLQSHMRRFFLTAEVTAEPADDTVHPWISVDIWCAF
jgi:hypothetical protein